MKEPTVSAPVERLFPFVLRSRILVVGRDTLRRRKGHLHFVLITTDLSENSRQEVLRDFAHYPVVQHYTSGELEKLFNLKSAKVVGFAKSGLAQSIYAELKQHRINLPPAVEQQRNEGTKDRGTGKRRSSARSPDASRGS